MEVNRESVDYFPLWRPHWITENRFNSSDYKKRYKALRNSSDGFITKEKVRDVVFKADDYKCVYCNSTENLTVDHIVAVVRVATREFPLEKLNIRENLQTLCGSCNSGKLP